jgi:iron(III) transport system permease protein
MGATFQSSSGTTYAMVIQSMTDEEGRNGFNRNATGRRCASTVFIMIVSGIILYLVYGVGARDLGERLEHRRKRRELWARLTGESRKEKAAEVRDA